MRWRRRLSVWVWVWVCTVVIFTLQGVSKTYAHILQITHVAKLSRRLLIKWRYSFGFVHRAMVKCTDVSAKHNASTFKVIALHNRHIFLVNSAPTWTVTLKKQAVYPSETWQHLTLTRYKNPNQDHGIKNCTWYLKFLSRSILRLRHSEIWRREVWQTHCIQTSASVYRTEGQAEGTEPELRKDPQKRRWTQPSSSAFLKLFSSGDHFH